MTGINPKEFLTETLQSILLETHIPFKASGHYSVLTFLLSSTQFTRLKRCSENFYSFSELLDLTQFWKINQNHGKSLSQNCERSELRLHLSGQKLIKNAKSGQFWRVFENLKLAGQLVLPDRSVLIGQKFENFQTISASKG